MNKILMKITKVTAQRFIFKLYVRIGNVLEYVSFDFTFIIGQKINTTVVEYPYQISTISNDTLFKRDNT